MRQAFYDDLGKEFDLTPMACLEETTREDPIVHLAHEIFREGNSLRISLWSYLEGAGVSAAETLGRELNYRGKFPNIDDLEKDEDLDKWRKLTPIELTKLRSLVGLAGYAVSSLRGDGAVAHSAAAQGLASGDLRHYRIASELIEALVSSKYRELCWDPDKVDYSERNEEGKIKMLAYWDANFGFGKARTGGVIRTAGFTCSLICKKQTVQSQSTTEAELISGSYVAREAVGLLNLLSEIFMIREENCILDLMGDNAASIAMACGQTNIRRVRHLHLADLYLRELCRDDVRVHARWIEGGLNPADLLTKVLQGEVFQRHLAGIGFDQS